MVATVEITGYLFVVLGQLNTFNIKIPAKWLLAGRWRIKKDSEWLAIYVNYVKARARAEKAQAKSPAKT